MFRNLLIATVIVVAAGAVWVYAQQGGDEPEASSQVLAAAEVPPVVGEGELEGAPATPVPHESHEAGALTPEERARAEKSEFSVRFKDEVSPYDTIGVFMMPGEEMEIEAVFERIGDGEMTYVTENQGGTLVPDVDKQNRWNYKAPLEPGLYPIKITNTTDHTVTLNVFVKVPYESMDNSGEINEFRVGSYPDDDEFGRKALYEQPDGFIEVTRDNRDTLITPHLAIGQFVSKQASDHPKYVFLRERLLLKLELLRNAWEEAGYDADHITIMSGYRTPFYNRAIGNVKGSRHVYGDAADIFIDNNEDGRMDDLTGDGKSNYADAQAMAAVVEDLVDQPHYKPFIGGLGVYGSAPHRGPFIHVDTRGFKARWTAP